ncbi:MAG: cytochrome c [Acidobacteria bacterium]|nr:cytochrome c [Acidobacteriota bacterium]
MRCLANLLVPAIMALSGGLVTLAQTPPYNVGRPATDQEIRAWDIAIGPEGEELPPGSGTSKEGAKIYAQRCASCHGPTAAEGKFIHGPLLGGRETLTTLYPLKTLGSYWPFATGIWDYIRRGMPPGGEGSLTTDEVYHLTAFLLYRNGIIKETDVLNEKNLPKIQMPNRNGFVPAKPEWKPGEKRPHGLYP